MTAHPVGLSYSETLRDWTVTGNCEKQKKKFCERTEIPKTLCLILCVCFTNSGVTQSRVCLAGGKFLYSLTLGKGQSFQVMFDHSATALSCWKSHFYWHVQKSQHLESAHHSFICIFPEKNFCFSCLLALCGWPFESELVAHNQLV